MFKPVPMVRVRIVGLLRDLPSVIDSLYSLGVVDIRQTETDFLSETPPLPHFSRVSETLTRVQSIVSHLPPISAEKRRELAEAFEVMPLEAVLQQAESLVGEYRKLLDTRNNYMKELEETRHTLTFIEKNGLDKLPVDFSVLSSSLLFFKVVRAPTEEYQKLVAKFKPVEALAVPDGAYTVALLAFTQDVSVPYTIDIKMVKGRPDEQKKYLKGHIDSLEGKIRALNDDLTDSRWIDLYGIEAVLSAEFEKANVATNFARGERFFVISGWVPQKDFHRLRTIEKEKQVWITEIPWNPHTHHSSTHDIPPTLLDTPPKIKPFESMVRFLSIPSYDEINPSPFLLLFFPLLYGMMVGDVGYALLSLPIAYMLRRRLGSFYHILIFGAISTAFFGIVYDEWFGFSHAQLFGLEKKLYEGFSRAKNPIPLLGITILFGAIHLTVGFLIAAYNHRQERTHMVAKIAWALLIVSGIAIAVSVATNTDPIFFLLIAFISLFTILLTEGILGLIEIPTVLGNSLSYARVMAVGFSGVMIAEIANHVFVGKESVPSVLVSAPFIVFVLFIIHLLGTLLAMFEGSIQGSRLNFVEFFSKFFHGGGRPYRPFQSKI